MILTMAAPAWCGEMEITASPRVASASRPWLKPAQRQWLAARGPLTLGVTLPDYPPLSMVDAQRFQGITADYLGLLLPAPVRIRSYDSREAALAALSQGEIDLLGGGTPLEASRMGLSLSTPYLRNQPVLVSAVDAPFDPAQPSTRLAMTSDHLLPAQLTAAYPDSQPQVYETPRQALEALSLGEVDAFVGDAVSAHYLLEAHYMLNLKIQGFAPVEGRGFGLLVNQDDDRLLAYLDQALPTVLAQYGSDIMRNWNGGRHPQLGPERVALTPAESDWMQTHPKVTVALNGSLGALGQFDPDQRAHGIGPDYLELIASRTGLVFEYLPARNYTELEKLMRSGKAMITPAYAPTPNAPSDLVQLAPYLRTSVIVLTRSGGTRPDRQRTRHLDELKGKRVALVEGFFLIETIRQEHPGIRLQIYPDLAEALRSVDEGSSDAFVGNDYAARYANADQFGNRLRLAGILEGHSRPIGIAVQDPSPELRSILEKAQLSVSPAEIADIVHHWQPRHPLGGNRFWRDNRQLMLRLAALLSLLVAVSLIWGFYLMRQVRRTRQAERRAEAASQAKSLFLSTTSHEIRTPLSALIGLLEMAQKKAELGLPDRPSLRTAQDAAQGMMLLLGNVLDLHRIESGHIDSTLRDFAFKPLVESMVPLLQGLVRSKPLTLHTRVEASADHWVRADPLHIKQVLFNLLGNAIKFTDEGSVSLRATGRCEDGRLQLLLEVTDTGIGISAEDQARLFQPFTQADSARQRADGGSGLGLSITRRLVEHMGGTVTLESTLGKGSCFSVDLSLPLARPLAPSIAPRLTARVPTVRAARLSILAAEDYLFNRELLKSQLLALGQATTMAHDGMDAWEKWQRGQFHILITDGRMPRMDGAELIRRIRSQSPPQQRRRYRLIALTASTEDSEMRRYLEAGADEVLCKPLTAEDLARIISEMAILLKADRSPQHTRGLPPRATPSTY